jgi:hypothetical protein
MKKLLTKYLVHTEFFTLPELPKPTQTTPTLDGDNANLALAENTIHPFHPTPPWMVRLIDFEMLLLSKRGPSADFYTAQWCGREVGKSTTKKKKKKKKKKKATIKCGVEF